MNKNIGDMTESELKDFIIELQEENSRYARKNQKYKEVIDKIQKEMISSNEDNEVHEEYSIMGVKVVENYILEDILKEVE